MGVFQRLTIDPDRVLTNEKFFYDNVDWRGWDDRYTYHPGDSLVDDSRSTDQLLILIGDWYRYRSPPHDSQFYPALGLSEDVYVRNVYEIGGDFAGVDIESSFDVTSYAQFAEWEDRTTGQSGQIHIYDLIPEPIANIDDADVAPPYTSAARDWIIGSLQNDRIAGYAGSDRLEGGPGDDILLGDGSAEFEEANRVRITSPTSNIADGNDELDGGAGNDHLTGGEGFDSGIYAGERASYRITLGENTIIESLASDEGTDLLFSVERLHFSDIKVATDMSQTAGSVAKLVGALWGPSEAQNSYLNGYGIRLFDAGLSAEQVAEIGAFAKGAVDHESLCELLWTNIVGTPPAPDDIVPFVERLDRKEITVGDLIVEASDHPLNLMNIDFVGLSTTGVLYI